MFMSMSNLNIYHNPIEIGYFRDGGTKIQDGRRKKPSDQELKILHDTKQLKDI